MRKNIGIDAKPPVKKCNDRNCPWHGVLPVRGKIIEGKIVSTKGLKTVIVQRDYVHYLPKYERYERRRSRIPAYLPPCIEVEEGDWVKICLLYTSPSPRD